MPDHYYSVSCATWNLCLSSVTVGIAENTEAGAIVKSNDELCLVKDLPKWDSIYLGKEVKLSGQFTPIDIIESENNPFKTTNKGQNNFGYYAVSRSKWELYVPEVIIGTTRNTKGGAFLYGNGKSYSIAGLREWDSIYLDKTVKVTGISVLIDPKLQHINYENPFLNSLARQEPNGSYYIVVNPAWELYNPN